jgi:hypothetical protein
VQRATTTPLLVTCPSCNGKRAYALEEILHCSDCRMQGTPGSSLVYQHTIGTTAIWRCPHGHEWTDEIAPSWDHPS